MKGKVAPRRGVGGACIVWCRLWSSFVQRKQRLDHILSETTGLANPAPLASILWLDDQLESAVRLDCIITDVLILNKVDLISQVDSGSLSSDAFRELEKEIHDINALATIIPSARCQVDLHKILDRQAYGAKHLAHLDALLEDSKEAPTKSCHDYTVRTLCIYEQQPVDLIKVRLWFEDLLWEKISNMDVYRCKGVLYAHNSEQLHTLQAMKEL